MEGHLDEMTSHFCQGPLRLLKHHAVFVLGVCRAGSMSCITIPPGRNCPGLFPRTPGVWPSPTVVLSRPSYEVYQGLQEVGSALV